MKVDGVFPLVWLFHIMRQEHRTSAHNVSFIFFATDLRFPSIIFFFSHNNNIHWMKKIQWRSSVFLSLFISLSLILSVRQKLSHQCHITEQNRCAPHNTGNISICLSLYHSLWTKWWKSKWETMSKVSYRSISIHFDLAFGRCLISFSFAILNF